LLHATSSGIRQAQTVILALRFVRDGVVLADVMVVEPVFALQDADQLFDRRSLFGGGCVPCFSWSCLSKVCEPAAVIESGLPAPPRVRRFHLTGTDWHPESTLPPASLKEAVKTHSVGQISHALYDVGGEYRRNM
jgi:hypothetical protein